MFNRKKISLNAANKPENEKDLIIIFNNMKRSGSRFNRIIWKLIS